MSLTKEIEIDKIEVVEKCIVQVRQTTKILEDGNQLSQSYHRWTLVPGQDISDQEDKVQAVCNAVWTEEVIAAYQESLQIQR
jgi:hypothetical protein